MLLMRIWYLERLKVSSGFSFFVVAVYHEHAYFFVLDFLIFDGVYFQTCVHKVLLLWLHIR
jgi:hypothetical protein